MSNGDDEIVAQGKAPAMEQSDVSEQREELLQGIERDEEGMRVAVHELTGAARSKLDVREHIKTFPLTWTVGAFLVGVWLGRRGVSAGMGEERRS